MTELDIIVARLIEQRNEAMDAVARIQRAIEILAPRPEVKPVPATDQIKEGILRTLKAYGEKTHYQLGRILGITPYRAQKVAREMVEGGALEIRNWGDVPHFTIKRETLRIVAGEGVR